MAVLTDAAGIVRAEDLAHVLLERFRHQIAPETTRGLCVDDTDEQPAHANREPVQPLASICADELWLVSPASSG